MKVLSAKTIFFKAMVFFLFELSYGPVIARRKVDFSHETYIMTFPSGVMLTTFINDQKESRQRAVSFSQLSPLSEKRKKKTLESG